MDKLNLKYKFPPGVVSGSVADKNEFLNLLSNLNISDDAEIQAIFGEGLISQDLFFTYNSVDGTITKSFIVETASEELVTATYDRFSTLLSYLSKYQGGELAIDVENNVSPDLDQSLIDFTHTLNPHNEFLPTNQLFSYFENLQFYVDDTGAYIKTETGVEKYYNYGKISVVGNIDDISWYNYKSVYGRLSNSSVRLITPNFHIAIPNSYYSEFKNLTNEMGIPFIADVFEASLINEEYFRNFIDQIKTIIDAGKHINVYPNEVIKLENRLRDSSGYYFKYISFSYHAVFESFVDNQITYLTDVLSKISHISDKESIINYARSQWLQQ